MTSKIVLICLPIFLAAAAHAEDTSGHYEVLGTGNRTCDQYLTARNPNPYEDTYGDPQRRQVSAPDTFSDREYVEWMNGYLTAFDTWVSDTYSIRSGVGIEEMRNWLVQYCLSHRQAKFYTAVEAFVDLHFAKRISSDPSGPKR
ncbi:MAG TPA: hypothetical protein VLV85_08170 [Stellaceae bacterium]|jgi:hypothetical protein|nr:hypothetical protein [Stellaceae bacterium]